MTSPAYFLPAPAAPPRPAARAAAADPRRQLRQGVWLYFFLLIFEGALRKWFLPGLSTPLLIVRDPVALWLLVVAWKRGLLPANFYLAGIVLIGITGTFTAVLLGHGNLLVALFGARILVLHFPLMFVIGRVFGRSDVLKMGRALLWLAPPMTGLIAWQFYSPQSAWVNQGLGGDPAGAGFSGALDYLRPPGTFAFTNGVTLFYGLTGAFSCYFLLKPAAANRLLVGAAALALLVAVPLSISRGLFFQVIVTLLFTLLAVSRKPNYVRQMVVALGFAVLVVTLLTATDFFQTATAAFFSRFETASGQEGGLQGTLGTRYLGGLTEAIAGSLQQPFFGYGLGMGTNVGSMLLTGTTQYLISEGEWGRLVGELGPLLGLAVICLRLSLSFQIALASYRRLVTGDLLPWLLLSFGLLAVPQAQWAQPTSLGFSTLIGGLLLASLRPLPGPPHPPLPAP